ncbi:von Willebrand factor D and EGF domain-containing protein-like [Argopecten irradians]|uniref:von Willebrand factor D and EGF domain-containing protein-like n=1 Tax=Argopecten irradians TaxID=31199 RepID=UPI00371B201D
METCLSTGTFNTTVQPTEPYPLENETGPPNVTMTVEVTHGIKTSSMFNMIRKEIVFHCNITTDLCITDHVYDIQWFINDNGIVTHRNIPYTNLTQTGLRQSEWTGTYKLGFLVKCAVRARTDTDSTPTPYTYSDDFYAGFTTDQSEYSVPEDSSINITIRLSVPLDCIYLSNSIPDCSLKIRIKFPKHYDTDNNKGCTIVGTVDEPIAFGNTACGIFIKYSDWDVPKNMTIYGSADNIVTSSRSRTSYVRLVAEESFTSQAWASATIPDIKVNALDEDKKLLGKSCTIQTDPHINTFDGSHVLFMQYGEFILFKHDTLPIRIHAVFDKCWQAWRGACTCGVAIRYIDAVFVLNFCKVRIGAPWLYSSNFNRYVEMRACDATHMTIEYRRPAYKVTLPSGTEIHIGLHLGAINTHINMFILKPSLADWEATSGMCGFLDGDKNNDIRLRSGEIAPGFGVDWRHDNQMDGESLFASNGVLGDILLPQLRYCRCPVTSTQESGFAAVANCDLTSTITTCGSQTHYTNYFEQCSTSQEISGNLHRVVRRSTNDDFEIPKFDIALDENYAISEYNITWINGWNESLAEEACRNTMDSDPMLIRCKDAVAAMNDIASNGINECVGDIKISGHTGYMEGTLEALREHCLIEAIRFENLTTQESHGTNTTFLNELLKLNCPNNCSGNGHCEKGVCDCQDGFYGDSCTVGIETIPEVLSSGMICSIEKRSCRNFVIPGSNFLDVNLTCQVRMLQVYINRWEIIASPVLFPATYLNDFNCVCTIPDSYRRRRATDNEVLSEGYLLSISNDGIHFSNETTILTYDSSCYDCDPTNMNCSKLEESCDLTTTPTGTSEPSTLTDNTFTPTAILGCVIGIVVILGIVIAVGIIIKLKWFHVYNTTNTKVTELCNMSFNEKNTRVQNNIAEPSNVDYHFNENRLTSKVTEASPIDGQVFDDPMMVIDLEEDQPIGDKGDIVS